MFSNMPIDVAMTITAEQLEGSKAYKDGKLPSNNPYDYPIDSYLRNNGDNGWELWLKGWEEAYCYHIWQQSGDAWERGAY